MKNSPILIVAGEPRSVFFEIFFKSIKSRTFKSPLILICCQKKLKSQMISYNFKKKLRLLNINDLKKLKLDNKKINLIDIELKKTSNIKKNYQFSKIYIENYFKKYPALGFKLV